MASRKPFVRLSERQIRTDGRTKCCPFDTSGSDKYHETDIFHFKRFINFNILESEFLHLLKMELNVLL